MEKDVYTQVAKLENDNWWYKSRRHLLNLLLKSTHRRFKTALDVGCGSGANLIILKGFSKKVFGLDISKNSLKICKYKGYNKLILGNVEKFKSTQKFDLIVAMDILEHTNDTNTISNISKLLNKNGILIFSVPAHNYLWNANDTFAHHKKRYEIDDIKTLLQHNFKIIKLSPWNQIMFLPVWLYTKFINKQPKKVQNNLDIIPPIFNNLLYFISKIENHILVHTGLINGVSIICLAKKR